MERRRERKGKKRMVAEQIKSGPTATCETAVWSVDKVPAAVAGGFEWGEQQALLSGLHGFDPQQEWSAHVWATATEVLRYLPSPKQ